MNKFILLAATAATLVSTQVLGGHCPADVKAIDHALSKMSLPAAQMSEVKALRDTGDALHKEGKHKESTDTLAKAMRVILNSQ